MLIDVQSFLWIYIPWAIIYSLLNMGASFVPFLCSATQKITKLFYVLVYEHNLTMPKLTELYRLGFLIF